MYRTPVKYSSELLHKMIVWMGTTKSFLAIFLFVLTYLLLFSNPQDWTGNEENYFQLSLKRLTPERFFNSSAAFDNTQIKIASELLIGSVINTIGYDQAHAVLRIAVAIGYTIAISFLLQTIALTALESAVVLSAFCLADQQLMGGEWLFPGVEGKSFSYILVIFAIALILQRKTYTSIILFAGATYFHILVGGFWMLASFIHLFILQKDKKILKAICLYLLLISPFLALVLPSYLATSLSEDEARFANFIYAEIRNPHHIAPFASHYTFFFKWLPGITLSFILLLIFATGYRKIDLPEVGVIASIGLTLLLMATGISFLDRDSYLVAKFYMFRPSSLTLLLCLATLLCLLKKEQGQQVFLSQNLIFFIFIFGSFWTVAANAIYENHLKEDPLRDQRKLSKFIQLHTSETNIVLTPPLKDNRDAYVSLHRLLNRPTFVSYKFVPTNSADILEWNDRINIRKKIYDGDCELAKSKEISYLILNSIRHGVEKCGIIIHQESDLRLLKIKQD